MITWMVILTVVLIVVVIVLGYCYSVLREDHRKLSKLLRYDVRDHASKHFFVRQLENVEPYNPYDDTPRFIKAIADEIKYLEEAVDKPNALCSRDLLEELVDEHGENIGGLDNRIDELESRIQNMEEWGKKYDGRTDDISDEIVDLRKRVDGLDDDASELYRQYKQLAASEET